MSRGLDYTPGGWCCWAGIRCNRENSEQSSVGHMDHTCCDLMSEVLHLTAVSTVW